jgi:hypothetical protein
MQVKVSVVGAQLLRCREVNTGREALLRLPVVTGSLGAITLAASSCQQPAAVKAGGKLLSCCCTVGQLQVIAAAGDDKAAPTGSEKAAAFTLPGLSAAVNVAKVAADTSGDGKGDGMGGSSSRDGLRQRLFRHKQDEQPGVQQPASAQAQAKQQQAATVALKATCAVELPQQPLLHLHAAQGVGGSSIGAARQQHIRGAAAAGHARHPQPLAVCVVAVAARHAQPEHALHIAAATTATGSRQRHACVRHSHTTDDASCSSHGGCCNCSRSSSSNRTTA